MKFRFVDLEQGTDAWKNYRNKGIGASDIPSIANVRGAYQKPNDLLDQKLGREKIVSEYTQKIFSEGHALEEEVRQETYANLGKQFRPAVVESIEYPMFFASLDGITENNDAIIEVKSTRKQDFLRQVQEGYCPDIYFYQIQWQLFITGLKECTLIVVDAETRNKYPLVIDRDDSIIATLILDAQEFYSKMKAGIAPTKYVEPFDEIAVKMETVLISIDIINERLKELEAQKKTLANFLLEKYDARKLENEKICIQLIESQGSINYKDIPELKNVNLELYRGKPRTSLRVNLKGKKENVENV